MCGLIPIYRCLTHGCDVALHKFVMYSSLRSTAHAPSMMHHTPNMMHHTDRLHGVVFHQKLIYPQPAKKFPKFRQRECVLPCSQKPDTRAWWFQVHSLYSGTATFSFFKIYFMFIVPPAHVVSKWWWIILHKNINLFAFLISFPYSFLPLFFNFPVFSLFSPCFFIWSLHLPCTFAYPVCGLLVHDRKLLMTSGERGK